MTKKNKPQDSSDGFDPSPMASLTSDLGQWHSRMPVDPDIQRVFQARALTLAQDTRQEDQTIRETFLRIRLGPKEHYGIAYTYLEHIMKRVNISRIPCTSLVIAGVTNFRGELLTLLDLKQLFHMEVDEQPAESMIVVVRSGNIRVGLLIDDIEGNGECIVAELQPPMHTGGVSNLNYVQGIYQGQVALLNIEALLTDPLLRVDEGVRL